MMFFFANYNKKLISLFKILRDFDYFKWSIFLVNKRLPYRLRAMRAGIQDNHLKIGNLYNFRRNIHRIEKGLSYPVVKSVFAEDYILDTIQCLESCSSSSGMSEATRRWGESVLDLYFQTCEHSEIISEAYSMYKDFRSKESLSLSLVPYLSSSRPDLSVDYQSLNDLALRRRSIRFYRRKKVEPELIKKAMNIAVLSPSACNRQSFKFLFFNKREVVEKLASIPGGVSGYEIPSVVVVVGSYQGYFDERDINTPIIDASLASMAFLFALETIGLSSVCINWPSLNDREEKIREVITLEEHEIVVMMIGVGFASPNGKIPYSAKRETEEILFINERLI